MDHYKTEGCFCLAIMGIRKKETHEFVDKNIQNYFESNADHICM